MLANSVLPPALVVSSPCRIEPLLRHLAKRAVGVPEPGEVDVLPGRLLRRNDIAGFIDVGDAIDFLVARQRWATEGWISRSPKWRPKAMCCSSVIDWPGNTSTRCSIQRSWIHVRVACVERPGQVHSAHFGADQGVATPGFDRACCKFRNCHGSSVSPASGLPRI